MGSPLRFAEWTLLFRTSVVERVCNGGLAFELVWGGSLERFRTVASGSLFLLVVLIPAA